MKFLQPLDLVIMAASMTISLPESLQSWIEEQAAKANCRDPGQFIGQVLQAARRRHLRKQIEAGLTKALNSGSTPMTADDWEQIRREGRKRLARRKR